MAEKTNEWKVYFDGNFYGRSAKSRAGTELPIDAHFHWAERDWLVPAVYVCGKGLVVDCCMRVEADTIRSFLDKWNIHVPEDEAFLPEDAREQFALENPLLLHFQPRLTLNGEEMLPSHGCSFGYIPAFPEQIEPETAAILAHYGLDLADGWVVSRSYYPWKTKRRPQIKTLALTMEQQPENIPGSCFTFQAAGDEFSFAHPVTGANHTITALDLEEQTLDFPCDAREYPTHCLLMRYRVTPPIPSKTLIIQDTAPSDCPREIRGGGAESVGIIGGSDGPTAIIYGSDAQDKAAVSSLHFTPVEHVKWRLTFLHTRYVPETFELI